ncbi:acetyl-CoA carboxylase carboxyltransferase subunit alpha [Acetobacteraceae bacterium]|nr:acetyl-CoA carboxylase carboxyltransferase subunit alpha [Acetobacteraceae bacterium]
MRQFLDFEKSIAQLESKVGDLKGTSNAQNIESEDSDIQEEVKSLEEKVERRLGQIYSKLTAHQKVQVARHPQRPHAINYIEALTTDFTPLSGDRLFGDDNAMVGGLAKFRGVPVVVIGTERGHDTQSRVKHNFGMARPEGYRKAQRLMKLAAQFSLPILTFVDTAGAWPGIDAEARGQAEAIARSTDIALQVGVPVIATIIGEGGSGGAIAIAASDRTLMLEHSIYSVISPEAAASILWRDPSHASVAAESLKLTAQDLKSLGLINRIIGEPIGGAQRLPEKAIEAAGEAIWEELQGLQKLSSEELLARRRSHYFKMTRAAI